MLDCLEHNPGAGATSSVVWLHGLGASGEDFVPLVPHLGLPRTRFVFPHAPTRPVTVRRLAGLPDGPRALRPQIKELRSWLQGRLA